MAEAADYDSPAENFPAGSQSLGRMTTRSMSRQASLRQSSTTDEQFLGSATDAQVPANPELLDRFGSLMMSP